MAGRKKTGSKKASSSSMGSGGGPISSTPAPDEVDLLLQRITRLYEDCGGKTVDSGCEDQSDAEKIKNDPFVAMQEEATFQVRQANEQLRLRNELLASEGEGVKVVTYDQHIRKSIMAVEAIQENMQAQLDTIVEKTKPKHRTSEWEQLVSERRELIDLVGRHVENLRSKQAKRDGFGAMGGAAVASKAREAAEKEYALFGSRSDSSDSGSSSVVMGGGLGGAGRRGGYGGGGGAGTGAADEEEDPPDLDHLQLQIQLAYQQEDEIDGLLDELEQGLMQVRGQVLAMGDKLDEQEVIIADTKDQMDEVQEDIQAQTKQMKELVKKMGGTNKVLTRMIIFGIILILIGLIVNFLI